MKRNNFYSLVCQHFQDVFSYKTKYSPVPVTHACNPSYSGGRDQEDRDLKPAWQIVHGTLSQKNLHKKKKKIGLVEWVQGEGPEVKPQYHKKRPEANA
jgi:hypothetical protein